MSKRPARPAVCPEACRVLLIGGGGREHALAWKLAQSPRLAELWRTDDVNVGLRAIGKAAPPDFLKHGAFRMGRWCDDQGIDLVIVGPEAPLAAGLADELATDTRVVFGPGKAGARLEADKVFAKKLMRQAAVPTADGRTFDRVEFAREYLLAHEHEACVVKCAGLAGGKGVVVCDGQAEALEAVEQMMVQQIYGDAGAEIVIEERLQGQEISILALVDNRTIWLLDPAQDHKQRDEGDTGPNTGGMGAYCPTSLLDAEMLSIIETEVFVPTLDALRREAIDYRGVLYAGLMLTAAGPKVLEFNCRFGDPECQPLMARLQGDLVEICWATAAGQLDDVEIDFDDRVACCVVLCSEGYPGKYQTGRVITGIAEAEALGGADEDVIVFHAGTKLGPDGSVLTNGGRVLGVTALANDLTAARTLANTAAETIQFDGKFFRRDIGGRVMAANGV